MNYDSGDEKDVKPLIERNSPTLSNGLGLSTNGSKKWLPGTWQDGNRESAFQPYKPTSCTVLTNLQRGNTQAATPVPEAIDVNFHTRAGQGEITEVDVRNEKSVDVCDSNGLTALHWAAHYGQLHAVMLLLSKGTVVDILGPEGETPLLLAANGGHVDVVRQLLQNGASVNHVDDVGNTALMYAASGNHPHTCNELILHGANLTVLNHCDQSAYQLTIKFNANLAQSVMEDHLLHLLTPSSSVTLTKYVD